MPGVSDCMATTDRSRHVVSDAGPLIHLDELDSLDLLNAYGPILITPAVWREVHRHRPTALSRLPPSAKQREPQGISDDRLVAILEAFSLAPADREALAMAQETPGALFLTDDAAVRLVAEQLGIEARGTVGILIRAIRQESRTRAAVLDTLQTLPVRSSLHIRPALLQEIITLVRVHGERTR